VSKVSSDERPEAVGKLETLITAQPMLKAYENVGKVASSAEKVTYVCPSDWLVDARWHPRSSIDKGGEPTTGLGDALGKGP
jgi:hypothetical protein